MVLGRKIYQTVEGAYVKICCCEHHGFFRSIGVNMGGMREEVWDRQGPGCDQFYMPC